MPSRRSNMTVRVIRLGDPAGGDPRMGGTVAERVAAVDELTQLAWTLAGRRFPRYRRPEMPVVVTTLAADAEPR